MIKNILHTVGRFMRKRGFLILIVALILFIPDIASAADATATSGTAGQVAKDAVEQTLLTTVNFFIRVLNMLLWPLLLIIGDLMSNDLIIGPGMEQRLLSIWQQIRNLVNIAFVLILLIMAFYNVSGFAKDGDFALKTGLPKLIIGLILVNFTFLGGKLVLDVSGIATNAVFALPELVANSDTTDTFDFQKNVNDMEKELCIKVGGVQWDKKKDTSIPAATQIFCDQTDGKYSGKLGEAQKTKFFKNLNANNIGLMIAINMGHLESLNYAEGAVSKISDLVVNTIFSIAMFIVFAVTYLVLALVLVARVAVLWVALAFSPVIVLFYVIPGLKSGAGDAGNMSEKVLTHILAPIKIGIVLTVGFLMLDAMNGIVGASQNSAIGKSKLSELADGTLLITGIADLQKLIIAITSIMVLWIAVFKAADGTVAQSLVDKVKGAVEGAGTGAMGLLKYTPLTPIQVQGKDNKPGETEMASWANLTRIGSKFKDSFVNAQNEKADALYSKLGLDLFGGGGKAIESLARALEDHPEDTSVADIKKGLLSDEGGLNRIKTDEGVRRQYDAVIRGLIDKYVQGEDKKKTWLKDYERNKNNPPELGKLIRNVTVGNITWSTDEAKQLENGAEAATPATTPPATPPAPTTKLMNTLAATAPAGITINIPPTLNVPTAVVGFDNLATAADAAMLNTKLATANAQAQIDAYMVAYPAARRIDVRLL